MRRACSPPAGAIVAVRHAGLVHYARDCTETDDRILATWFHAGVVYLRGEGLRRRDGSCSSVDTGRNTGSNSES